MDAIETERVISNLRKRAMKSPRSEFIRMTWEEARALDPDSYCTLKEIRDLHHHDGKQFIKGVVVAERTSLKVYASLGKTIIGVVRWSNKFDDEGFEFKPGVYITNPPRADMADVVREG